MIGEFRANTSGLNPLERRIAEAEATTELFHRYRSLAAANEILQGQTMETVGPFEFVDGKSLIRAADPREACSTSPYLVDGMIPEGALGEVIADYGCGKTWLMIDLALSVAFGVQFFGNEVQKRSVLYLAYEGQHGLWKRMAGWLHYHGFLPAEFTAAHLHDMLEGRITVAAIPPLFDHPSLEEGLRDSVRELEAGLVIIDTRNKSLGPDQSEDSNDTAGHVNGVLSRVAAQTGCTFFTTHHIGHTKKARGRGASAWTQGVDFSFLIAGNAAMMAAGYPMTVNPLKMRDDQWPDQVAFRLKKIKGLCVDGQDWNTAVIHAVSAMPAVQDRASIQARVFSYVQGHPGCSGEAVRRAVHGNNDEIQAEKDRLVRMGAIENLGRPNRHSYHSAPGWHVNHKGEVVRLEEGDRKDAAGDADEPSPDEERTDA